MASERTWVQADDWVAHPVRTCAHSHPHTKFPRPIQYTGCKGKRLLSFKSGSLLSTIPRHIPSFHPHVVVQDGNIRPTNIPSRCQRAHFTSRISPTYLSPCNVENPPVIFLGIHLPSRHSISFKEAENKRNPRLSSVTICTHSSTWPRAQNISPRVSRTQRR